MNTFDVRGPLPRATTLLEASAGTGKTYAIAALAARYLAEDGADISELLLITFGNHASNELRSRLFARLRDTEAELSAHLAGEQADLSDPVTALLAESDAEVHRSRLADALARFNEATVLTTHAFCDAMLAELGILADHDRFETVGPDAVDVVQQCTVDTYLRRFRDDPEPSVPAKDAMKIGTEACLSNLPLLPATGAHREFADDVRALYASRKMTLGLRTFNDVTARLHAALADEVTGPVVKSILRRRFRYVLVDEFQDTDPEQWAIIESAFVAPERTTVLIGDPKQSIYGFRGADLGSYLDAKRHAHVATLGTNFRSDRGVVDGVIELFGDRTLGADDVVVQPVSAHHGDRLPALGDKRLRVRQASADGLTVASELAIEHDLVREVRSLLTIVDPSQIAVLVRTGATAQRLARVLTTAGHPAVVTGSQSVWDQPAAQAWATLLRAMDTPTQASIRLAALTPLVGAELGDLFDPASETPARTSALVRDLAHRFDEGGIQAVLEGLRTSTDLDARLLTQPEGDRLLTDVNHIGEILALNEATSLQGLIAFLERDRSDDDADALRVSTDLEAIRIMTLHAAKGLEFPVVLLPETVGSEPRHWQPFSIVEGQRRHLWIGPRPDRRDTLAQELRQQNLEEELRLLYVGLTRGQHLSVAWHVEQGRGTAKSPLGLLLDTLTLPRAVSVEPLDPSPVEPKAAPPTPDATLTPPRELRSIDQTWRRTSYSGLTADLHEVPGPVVRDEPEIDDVTPPTPEEASLLAPSPMAGLPAGAAFGTLVHEVFERLDWGPTALEASATALIGPVGPAHGLTAEQTDDLISAVVAASRTPLHPLTTHALTDLPTSHRLPELDFDLPLADGGAPSTLAELADLMAAHLPSDDPLAEYPPVLRASQAASALLNGFLTGSIDAVLKLDDGSFAVVDYKTNRLVPADTAITVGHFTQTAMAEAMIQAHYPLQAMLYCVALHRYLGARLPDYDPERHLGGVGYLFVRGMAGPDTPVVDGASCGVFGWFPPAALVVAASDLLGGKHA